MKCPACEKTTISFLAWGRRSNAFRHQCPHCGRDLRASRATIFWFVFLLALMPFFIYGAERLSDHFHIADSGQRRLVFAGLMLPSVMMISFFVWRCGSYRARE